MDPVRHPYKIITSRVGRNPLPANGFDNIEIAASSRLKSGLLTMTDNCGVVRPRATLRGLTALACSNVRVGHPSTPLMMTL